jgi:hypothetical protein
MAYLLSMMGVAVCGLITSVLTALGVVVIENLTGLSIFTFSIWLVIPAGAIATGMAAASGYYFGSLYFHRRPNWFLLIQMIIIAGTTQLLIYYLEYTTLVLDNGVKASALVLFTKYLDISLTSAHYRVGRAGQVDTGEVGQFGYWLALIQFVGFLLGGFGIYVVLLSYPVCQNCQKYFRVLAKRTKHFNTSESFSVYYENIFRLPLDSNEFAAAVSKEHKLSKIDKGTILLETKLHGCPSCKSEMIEDKVSVWNGREWKSANALGRRVALPDGVNLVPIFRPHTAVG